MAAYSEADPACGLFADRTRLVESIRVAPEAPDSNHQGYSE
jgi:hypothetical protein